MHPQMDHLRNLSTAEKLRLVEELWDDIEASGSFPLPAWHQEEAERRAAELEAHPEIALTREELWRRVNAGNG